MSKALLSKQAHAPYIAAAMPVAETKPPRAARLGAAAVVALLHVLAIAMLIRAFAPQFGAAVTGPVTAAFDVALPVPTPTPTSRATQDSTSVHGAAAPAGKQATPREAAAPPPRIVLAEPRAPVVAASGDADRAGAAEDGTGTGAGGMGEGLGAGSAGDGTGGAGPARPIKIAGDIVSARDYPRKTRALRLGSAVTVGLTVTVDGRVGACRILRPSRDAEADRITCRLASERFRFRPARDAAGRPIAAEYGWQQRWFTAERE